MIRSITAIDRLAKPQSPIKKKKNQQQQLSKTNSNFLSTTFERCPGIRFNTLMQLSTICLQVP
jgi:hypothetical protein